MMRWISRGQSPVILLLALLFTLLVLSPPASAFECGYGLDGDRLDDWPDCWQGGAPELPPGADTWVEVPAILHGSNTAFRDVFVLFIACNVAGGESPANWHWEAAEYEAFMNFVLPNVSTEGQGQNLAKLICRYFSEDIASFENQHLLRIRASENGEVPDQVLPMALPNGQRRFRIYLYDDDRYITACADAITVHLWGGETQAGQVIPLPPEEVAQFAFTHEWQHVCHNFYTRQGAGAVSFGGSNAFNEFCSKLAEYKFGGGEASSHAYDFFYDESILGGQMTFDQRCYQTWNPNAPAATACDAPHFNHYYEWAHLGTYLDNSFTRTDDYWRDLVWDWSHLWTEVAAGDTVYYHSLPGLQTALSRLQPLPYDDYFTETGTLRVNELLHKYNVAKVLNAATPSPSAQLYQWHERFTPRALYGFWADQDGQCYTNIKSTPIYHRIAAAAMLDSRGGRLCSHDEWPNQGGCLPNCEADTSHENWTKYRFVQLSEYAANYLVFVADPSLASGRLSLSITGDAWLGCMECDDSASPYYRLENYRPEPLAGVRLYYDVIAYSGLDFVPDEFTPGHTLDVHGDNGSVIASDSWLEPSPGQNLNLVVEGFGPAANQKQAIVVVLSLYPDAPADNLSANTPYPPKAFPYRYSWFVAPEPIPITTGTIEGTVNWPANSLHWLAGPLTINGTLRVHAGAQILMTEADAALQIGSTGSLLLLGAPEARQSLGPLRCTQPAHAGQVSRHQASGGSYSKAA